MPLCLTGPPFTAVIAVPTIFGLGAPLTGLLQTAALAVGALKGARLAALMLVRREAP
jgi:hypothetical protein